MIRPDCFGWHWHLYLMGSAPDRPMKIGTAVDPMKRMKLLQPGHPGPLRIMWWGHGNAMVEQQLHKHFADRLVHEEWFDFSGVDAVELVSRAALPLEGLRGAHEISRHLREAGRKGPSDEEIMRSIAVRQAAQGSSAEQERRLDLLRERPEAWYRAVRAAAQHFTGVAPPEDEPLEVTERNAGLRSA